MSTPFWILVAISAAMILRGVTDNSRIWQAPTWVGFIVVAYLIPQAIFVEKTDLFLRLDAPFGWLFFSLCLIAFWVGFESALKRVPPVATVISERRLAPRAFVVLVVGSISLIQMNQIAATTELGSQWTGVITLYYLLFQCIFFSISIFLILSLTKRKKIYILAFLIAFSIAMIAISVNAKRSLTAEVAIICGAVIYLVRGWVPPKVFVAVGMLLGTVLLHQVGAIREYIKEDRGSAFEAVIEGVPFENFEYFEYDRSREVTHALVDIQRSKETGYHYGGAAIWNRVVHQYVPAFLLGRQVKESIKFPIRSDFEDDYGDLYFFGSTRTGFADAYMGFGVFGAILFAIIGVIMGKIYSYARAGRTWAIYIYPLLVNDAMFSFTESIGRFFSGGIFVVVVGLFLFYQASAPYRKKVTYQRRGIFHLGQKNQF